MPAISVHPVTANICEKVKILFIEYEEGVRNLAREIFETDGWNIVCVDSGNAAREVFNNGNGGFSLLISDVVLSDCNGLGLVEEFKKISPQIKVILSSGYSGEMSNLVAIYKKKYGFIQKPYNIEEMKEIVKAVVLGSDA